MRDITLRPRVVATAFALIVALIAFGVLLLPRGGSVSANPVMETVAVAAGGNHTCAVTEAGGVVCWGDNHYGQLGDGTTADRLHPVSVTGLGEGVVALAVGDNHTCALLDTDGVKCWGYNRYGQLGNGTVTGANDGSPLPTDVVGLDSGVAAITAGASHTCALLETGGVKCWGWNRRGQDGVTEDCSMTSCRHLSPVDVQDLAGVVAIDAGLNHNCAVLAAGAVKCWGQNDVGQLGASSGSPCVTETLEPIACSAVPLEVPGVTGATAIATGGIYDGNTNSSHSCAVTAGAIKCWGSNSSGQLGDNQACGMVCQSATTVVDYSAYPVTGAAEVSAGGQHTCYRGAPNDRVYCWGEGSDGQIGNANALDRTNATEICANQMCNELNGVDAISLGLDHGCALHDGGLICWGNNDYGQLGDGAGCDTPCSTPVNVATDKGDLPDLVFTTARIELETGGSCAFTSTALGTRMEFKNIGTADAGPFVVEVNGAQLTFSAGLAAGEEGDIWFPNYHYGEPTIAMLDATFMIEEFNETNNGFNLSVPIPTLPPTCTPTGMPSVTPTPIQMVVEGDSNCDRTVNSIDAALVLQKAAGLLSNVPCPAGGDANDDGTINSIDAALILQYVAGLLDSL